MAHQEDNINTSMVAVVGIISAGISFALIILLMVLYHSFVNPIKDASNNTLKNWTADNWNAQRAILDEASWVNQETGQVRIPVSDAMTAVVAQLQETPDDAGVNPPQFAQADATIADPTAAADPQPTASEEKPASEGEQPTTDNGSPQEATAE